jgi:hypothetical protein
MRKAYIIIIGIALLILSCGDGQGGKINKPYDGGHGIGIDTETVKQIQQYEDSIRAAESVDKKQDCPLI